MASRRSYKVWKAIPESEVGFMVTPESAVMVGSRTNFFVSSKGGNVISGPISFLTTSERKRTAGLFVELPDFVKMIPGTIVTPGAAVQQIPFPPIQFYAVIAKSMPFMAALALA